MTVGSIGVCEFLCGAIVLWYRTEVNTFPTIYQRLLTLRHIVLLKETIARAELKAKETRRN